MEPGKLLRRVAITAAVSLASLAAVACAPPEETEDEGTGTLSDALAQADWDRAVRHLAGLRYLPWTYYEDGCYARALYYSLNLASEGVASNHVYVVAKPGHGLGSTGRWRYHVAPLVSKDGDARRLYVLDPVYDRQSAQTLDRWVGRQISIAPGQEGYPSLHVMPGTSYGTPGQGPTVSDPVAPEAATFREPLFSAMPSFPIGTVSAACDRMHQYIDRETTTTDAQKADKHKTLARETRRLVTAVAGRGKLQGNAAELSATCTAWDSTLAACPADDGVTNPGSSACCLASAHFCWDGVSTCAAPGAVMNGRTCGEGGNWVSGGSSSGGSSSGGSSTDCPADSPTTNPVSERCCLASKHWCWSGTGLFCAAPGTQRNGKTCGAGGEWR